LSISSCILVSERIISSKFSCQSLFIYRVPPRSPIPNRFLRFISFHPMPKLTGYVPYSPHAPKADTICQSLNSLEGGGNYRKTFYPFRWNFLRLLLLTLLSKIMYLLVTVKISLPNAYMKAYLGIYCCISRDFF
jgi:hypothetical protein